MIPTQAVFSLVKKKAKKKTILKKKNKTKTLCDFELPKLRF